MLSKLRGERKRRRKSPLRAMRKRGKSGHASFFLEFFYSSFTLLESFAPNNVLVKIKITHSVSRHRR